MMPVYILVGNLQIIQDWNPNDQWQKSMPSPTSIRNLRFYILYIYWKATFNLRVSCQKGPTYHAYAWQIGPFRQDTLVISVAETYQAISIHNTGPIPIVPHHKEQVKTFLIYNNDSIWRVKPSEFHTIKDICPSAIWSNIVS